MPAFTYSLSQHICLHVETREALEHWPCQIIPSSVLRSSRSQTLLLVSSCNLQRSLFITREDPWLLALLLQSCCGIRQVLCSASLDEMTSPVLHHITGVCCSVHVWRTFSELLHDDVEQWNLQLLLWGKSVLASETNLFLETWSCYL